MASKHTGTCSAIWGRRGFAGLGYWNMGVPDGRNIGVLDYWDFEVLDDWN